MFEKLELWGGIGLGWKLPKVAFMSKMHNINQQAATNKTTTLEPKSQLPGLSSHLLSTHLVFQNNLDKPVILY